MKVTCEFTSLTEITAFFKAFEILQVSLANGKETPKEVSRPSETVTPVAPVAPKPVVTPVVKVSPVAPVVAQVTPVVAQVTPKVSPVTPVAPVAPVINKGVKISTVVTEEKPINYLEDWAVLAISMDKDDSGRYRIMPHTKMERDDDIVEWDDTGVYLNGKKAAMDKDVARMIYGKEFTYTKMKIAEDLLKLYPGWREQLEKGPEG